jgi:hypothetical protein
MWHEFNGHVPWTRHRVPTKIPVFFRTERIDFVAKYFVKRKNVYHSLWNWCPLSFQRALSPTDVQLIARLCVWISTHKHQVGAWIPPNRITLWLWKFDMIWNFFIILRVTMIHLSIFLCFSARVSQYRLISFTNFNAQFLYSLTICMLHYNPRHVSSINMLIFRRTNRIIKASGIVTLCKWLYSMSDESRLQSSLLSSDILLMNKGIVH